MIRPNPMNPNVYDLAKGDAQLAKKLADAVQAVGAQEGSILLLTPSGQALKFAICSSSDSDKLVDTQQPVTRGVVGLVASPVIALIAEPLQLLSSGSAVEVTSGMPS